MSGRDKRKKRARQRRDQTPIRSPRDPFGGMCPNGCGGLGPHFVPPSLGDRGFYACTPTTTPRETDEGVSE